MLRTDSDSAAADSSGFGCGQFRIRLLHTDPDSATARNDLSSRFLGPKSVSTPGSVTISSFLRDIRSFGAVPQAGSDSAAAGFQIRLLRFRIRVGVSDGADRFGFGCRRQIRLRLPPTDSASAAADRFGFGCCRQIRIRLPQTDSNSAAAHRFAFTGLRPVQARLLRTDSDSAAAGCCTQVRIRLQRQATSRHAFWASQSPPPKASR